MWLRFAIAYGREKRLWPSFSRKRLRNDIIGYNQGVNKIKIPAKIHFVQAIPLFKNKHIKKPFKPTLVFTNELVSIIKILKKKDDFFDVTLGENWTGLINLWKSNTMNEQLLYLHRLSTTNRNIKLTLHYSTFGWEVSECRRMELLGQPEIHFSIHSTINQMPKRNAYSCTSINK